MPAHGARENQRFHVTAHCSHVGHAQRVIDALDVLFDDRTVVERRRHVMGGRADQLDAVAMRLFVGPCALEARQKAVVDVDRAALEHAAERLAQNLHVTREHHQLDALCLDQFLDALFLRALDVAVRAGGERQMMKRHVIALQTEETVLVIGQGPIGLILAILAKRLGARVITSDLHPARLTIANSFGLKLTIDASKADAGEVVRGMTEGRGADAVILAVGGSGLIRPAMDAARPGGRVLLFAQTVRGEAAIDPAAVCVDEKALLGSYSASVELQEESVRFVMNREMDLERLISHRFALQSGVEALNLAAHPQADSMKIVIQPGSEWEGHRL